jgi:glycerol-3-phosphate dehydrogenase (NAD(P)+)
MLIGASEGLSNSKATKELQSKYFLNTAASLIHRSISEMVEFVSALRRQARNSLWFSRSW